MKALYYAGAGFFVLAAIGTAANGFDTHVLTHSRIEGALLFALDLVFVAHLWTRARRTR
jgi:hypothetical protein